MMDFKKDKKIGSLFLKQIKHDFLIGIFYSWKNYIPVVLIFLFACSLFHSMVSNNILNGSIEIKPSFTDYIIETYKGMAIYDTNRRDIPFQIPVIWLLINIYIIYLVSIYPLKDLYSYGQQILLRSKNRKLWWLSKCIWNVTTVILFYSIGYIVIFLFCIFTGTLTLKNNLEINLLVSNVNTDGISTDHILIIAVFLPIISSIGLSLFQMLMAFIIKPLYSCILIITILISSAYFCVPWLIGNYLMILRNQEITHTEGIASNTGICLGILISISSCIFGYLRFRSMDILEKK